MNSSLSDKVRTKDRTNLCEKGESAKTKLETAEALNKFFSNIVNYLEISKYSKYKSFINNIEDQTLRTILKYKNHPTIIAIQRWKCFFISGNSKKRKFKKKFIN